jgi:hypothetical protein
VSVVYTCVVHFVYCVYTPAAAEPFQVIIIIPFFLSSVEKRRALCRCLVITRFRVPSTSFSPIESVKSRKKIK